LPPLTVQSPELVYEGPQAPGDLPPLSVQSPELVYEGPQAPGDLPPLTVQSPELVYEGPQAPGDQPPLTVQSPELFYDGLPQQQQALSGELPRERRGITVRLLRVTPLDGGRAGLDPFDFREVERQVVEAQTVVSSSRTTPITIDSFAGGTSGDAAFAGPSGSNTFWDLAHDEVLDGVGQRAIEVDDNDGLVEYNVVSPFVKVDIIKPSFLVDSGTLVTIDLRGPSGNFFRIQLAGTLDGDDVVGFDDGRSQGILCGRARCP
jgi:hypothetical protein